MNREEAILAAIEFFEQPNSKDHWEYNKTTREEIVAALRTRPEAERRDEELLDCRAKLALAAEYEAGTEELLDRIKRSRHWAEEGQAWGYLIDEHTHYLLHGPQRDSEKDWLVEAAKRLDAASKSSTGENK